MNKLLIFIIFLTNSCSYNIKIVKKQPKPPVKQATFYNKIPPNSSQYSNPYTIPSPRIYYQDNDAYYVAPTYYETLNDYKKIEKQNKSFKTLPIIIILGIIAAVTLAVL